ncbi:hypothetical protein [Acidovorax sp. Leaf160]|uniref:hypothetical protein n=1 Tax=Acidovorax sp. Leaf160 TaxID=1736280 RepID=UPI0006FC6C02|nr:hypothetical protein [Acidovorax sp. Leaf160]KQR62637.1 hypothetical protein ASF94_15570 [Acidovorax sp. Leaf160]
MNFKTWLGQERGRTKALSSHLGVSLARVSQMSGDGVPVHHMPAVRDFTSGEVSIEEMVEERASARSAPAKEVSHG